MLSDRQHQGHAHDLDSVGGVGEAAKEQREPSERADPGLFVFCVFWRGCLGLVACDVAPCVASGVCVEFDVCDIV